MVYDDILNMVLRVLICLHLCVYIWYKQYNWTYSGMRVSATYTYGV